MEVNNIQTCYEESFQFLQARKKRQAQQLVLLSNLRRGDQNISSTMMLTLFDRVMGSLYDDKIQVKFIPSQGITQEQINDYNALAQSDYQEMQKAKLDYDWVWDTLFFGRGYTETVRFDRKKKIMQPHVINPLNFGYDPYMENVQEWRYYWKWLTKSKYELKKLQKAGALKKNTDLDSLRSGIDPYLWDYKVMRDQAREGVAPSIEPYQGDVYQVLEFYGVNKEGMKCVYWTDKDFSKILYEKELDFEDGDEVIMPDGMSVKMDSKWPIVMKESFRIPHQSLPVSVADLLEDKHRAKAVLLNLAYIAAKDTANPLYGYNPDKVRDITQLMQRQVSQHIPADDETAIWPLNKASTMSPDLQAFIQYLDREAEEPMGAGKPMQEAGTKSPGTATQAAIDQQLNDVAQSLQSKVLQFGESEFWSSWFHRYAKNADALKEKTANIMGIKGVNTMRIDLKSFNAEFPPGVLVFSAKEAEYKNLVKRRDWMQLYPALMQSMDPDSFRNWNKHVFMPLMIEDPGTIDAMFPKTIDEIKADDENEELAKDVIMPVDETDDDTTHIYSHSMVPKKTWAVLLHIDWHEKSLADKKKQEMMAQQAEQQGNMDAKTGQKPMGKEKKSPTAAASPLKTEIVSNNLQK